MIKSSQWLFACIVVLGAGLGCGSGGGSYKPAPKKPVAQQKLEPGQEQTLFPLAVGNQWTYELTSTGMSSSNQGGSSTGELTLTVKKVTPIADGLLADVEVTSSQATSAEAGRKPDIQQWEVSKRGIFQRAVGSPQVPFDPPQPVLLFPPDPNREFAWKGKGMTPASKSGTQSLESKVLPMQQVDAANGTYWAIPVESKGTFQTGDAKGQIGSIAFWAPKVGLVRFRQEIATSSAILTLTIRLKSSTVR